VDQELVSLKVLAAMLDCSPKTVRDWMYRDRKRPATDPLPYSRVGGLIRFRWPEVRAWIDRRRVRVELHHVAVPDRRNRPLNL